jgi:hypothetical protein
MGQKQKQLNMTNGGGKVRFYVCTFVHILSTIYVRCVSEDYNNVGFNDPVYVNNHYPNSGRL